MLIALQRSLWRSPLWSIARDAKDPVSLARWTRRGRPLPPPSAYKRQVIRDYARRFNLDCMVETGTLNGEMGFAMHSLFSRFVTIELSKELHAAAEKRLARFKNVECRQGDSSVVLPALMTQIHAPCLFWLDAHYSGGSTALGEMETPISTELRAVLTHNVRGHVVLIDDARCFDGTHDYPRVDILHESVLRERPDMTFSVENDIVRITPR